MNQSYYFDANFIIAYFDKNDEEKHKVSKETIRRTKNIVRKNPEINVKIPSIAIAEVASWLLKRSILPEQSHDLARLARELEADFPSPKKEHYKEAISLLERDRYLEPHDSLIVAHALLDSNTTHLLTFDTKLIDNREIENRKIELGNRFKIGPQL